MDSIVGRLIWTQAIFRCERCFVRLEFDVIEEGWEAKSQNSPDFPCNPDGVVWSSASMIDSLKYDLLVVGKADGDESWLRVVEQARSQRTTYCPSI